MKIIKIKKQTKKKEENKENKDENENESIMESEYSSFNRTNPNMFMKYEKNYIRNSDIL